jgi:hypothetical protein
VVQYNPTMETQPLQRGQFARVAHWPCVVIALYGDHPDVPEEHVGVWYGESDDEKKPRIRTVPAAYVEPLDNEPVYYH